MSTVSVIFPELPITHKRKTSSISPKRASFNTSSRRVSRFSISDPLNHNLMTPGPGSYSLNPTKKHSKLSQFFVRTQNSANRSSEASPSRELHFERAESQKRNQTIVYPHQQKGITLYKSSADRGLWEPKNISHTYRLPSRGNPGPGNYYYEPSSNRGSSVPFNSTSPKLDFRPKQGPGPGYYN